MNWDAIVVGGGCAGLAAATKLSEKGKRVLVLERRPLLGGRASSFRDETSGETLDNGQHLFLGCYIHTRDYLERIGATDRLKFSSTFEALMYGPTGEHAWLRFSEAPHPWNVASGLLRYKALPMWDRLKTLRVARSAMKGRDSLHDQTVTQWLASLGQSTISRDRLWDLLTLATLNIDPEKAPADLLAVVLKDGFLASKEASRVGLSLVGLSDLHAEPSRKYVEQKGGEVRLRASVKSFAMEANQMKGVLLADGSTESAPEVISAVPPSALQKLADENEILRDWIEPSRRMIPSPILSLHVWLDREISTHPFIGFWGQEFHWAFRKSEIYGDSKTKHVSMVTSSASRMLERSKEELIALCEKELKAVVPEGVKVVRAVVVRESEATWIPPLRDRTSRLSTETPIKGFHLAGDWTDTGLPATIEGAVKSGHAAADRLL